MPSHLFAGDEVIRALLVLAIATCAYGETTISVRKLDARTDGKYVELRGVGVSQFKPSDWRNNTLNFVADIREPLLAPREGRFRNIYAPSIVQLDDGWQIFYGGWDGVPTPNDRIYTAHTRDFLTFEGRRTVIEHGPFQHVCNVSAVRADDSWFDLICTAYPDSGGRNKPAFFHVKSTDSLTASPKNLITLDGYSDFPAADINGMNVLLRDGKDLLLYFGSFTDFGKTCRASSSDGSHYRFDGKALDAQLMVNDVKKLTASNQTWYLMALHHNAQEIFFALSEDSGHFPPPQKLFSSRGDADRYIVAAGWVMQGDCAIGVLYGAGAAPSLDQNRIFARWLQERVSWVKDDGARAAPAAALGPQRQLFAISGAGRFDVAGMGTSQSVSVGAGDVYEITVARP